MLSSAETIHIIAETLEMHKVPAIVLDPVRNFLFEWSLLHLLIEDIGYGIHERITVITRASREGAACQITASHNSPYPQYP